MTEDRCLWCQNKDCDPKFCNCDCHFEYDDFDDD